MKYFKFLFSGAFMAILLLVFAVAVGWATFIESDFDAVTAGMLVYKTWWFEAILFLMVVNFAGMIFTKKLFIKSKLNILFIHIALIIIIIGAGVTRYIGYEGQMHIRNGQVSNVFSSADTYIYAQLFKGEETLVLSEKVLLSTARQNLFQSNAQIGGEDFELSILRFLPNTIQTVETSSTGAPIIKVMVGSPAGRKEFHLTEGESKGLQEFTISFGETDNPDDVNIIVKDGQIMIKSPESVIPTHTSSEEFIEAGEYTAVDLMSVQKVMNTSFVITEFVEKGRLKYETAPDGMSIGQDLAHINVNGEYIYLPKGLQQEVVVGDVTAKIYLGAMKYELPFNIKLNEFDLERYPGSESPSSFASEVTVIDTENNTEFDYRIYMNHILNYGGYRFFQSSYDTDEQGTVLSVNHDYWGTLITYIGYALLFGTLIISFFTRKTRIRMIISQINETHSKRKRAVTAAILLFATFGMALAQTDQKRPPIDEGHASAFGKLLVQSAEGRIEPVNTVANKILVKIYKKDTYDGLNAEQVLLGIVSNPDWWENEPLIKVSESKLKNILEISGDHAKFSDFFDDGFYKIKEEVDAAYQKKPASRSTFDKEVINVDDRVNVLYTSLGLVYLKIFPIPDNEDNKWVTPADFHQIKGHGTAEGDMFENYILTLEAASTSNDFSEATANLETIRKFQGEYGKSVIPSSTRINLEIFYNEVNIFKRLFPLYFIIGILLVGFFFLQTFNPSLKFRIIRNVLTAILLISFLVQTFGLGLRWYISGHAPWSNGYESMIYIAWATMLAGFIFMRKTPVALAVTAILAGITLLTAHMSWLNPEITNLVPVLKSYWLTIHVATITASYGFLALSCMMGFLILCLMIFRNTHNIERVNPMLKELTLIVELSMSVGLILLIIGNFLGGIWANESWGRYWGWDPKESWTLVTIIFYSFVLHLRLIPSMRSTFSFNFLSVIGFSCVLMTYFGVNYYLSGLHSYADGDPIPVPSGVYYTVITIFAIGILASINDFKMRNKDEPNIPHESKDKGSDTKQYTKEELEINH